MSSSITVHNVKSIKTTGVSHNNANALKFIIERESGDPISLIVFDLPKEDADRIDAALNVSRK